MPGVHDVSVEGSRLRCLVPTSTLGDLLSVLAASGIESLVSQPPTLEQLFLRHYDGSDGRGVGGSGGAEDRVGEGAPR
jgi:ABC-2 type transport system ATP-binding protein